MRSFAVEALGIPITSVEKLGQYGATIDGKEEKLPLLTDPKSAYKCCRQYCRCGKYVGFLLTVV